ncbi:RelA/SpoT domain-containing protein [Rhizobium sp. YJ-22]|uniref:GTP pyrophosphokinase n=1 Tax=Rhizobium sp. YJ-22 TaxID=3037556 RepID=UPI0024126B93|nr:RelA/SpoT domain-containing protein [Rhizobium sp. YJ-22]MDG3576016.1 RelA/SpoT domain-containing protein [Rhizobium sp. YJ-22]
MNADVISDFLRAYAREFYFYKNAANSCATLCEEILETAGIRAIVSHRAKSIKKLADKIPSRKKAKHYASIDDVREDIVDLAGVRIALYFPGDAKRVKELLSSTFEVLASKTFPTTIERHPSNRFNGYYADHYRVRLKSDQKVGTAHDYAQASIEIQVGSVLMHAWAEVEHDLIYKPHSGTPSEEERAILDELNGLVLSGEIALERLQKAVQRRVQMLDQERWDSRYDLATLIYSWLEKNGKTDVSLGRIDNLDRLLRMAGIASATELRAELDKLTLVNKEPLALQLIASLLRRHPAIYLKFLKPDWGTREAHRDFDQALKQIVRAYLIMTHVAARWYEPDSENNIRDDNLPFHINFIRAVGRANSVLIARAPIGPIDDFPLGVVCHRYPEFLSFPVIARHSEAKALWNKSLA